MIYIILISIVLIVMNKSITDEYIYIYIKKENKYSFLKKIQ